MIKIEKYEDLRKFIKKFKQGYFDLIIIVGRGGFGKTYNTDNILNGVTCKVNSHITHLGLHELGYKYKDKLLWFDDVEALFNNDKLVGLMKQFAETQPIKHIKFLTSRELKVPQEYDTKSKVIMTCNSIKRIKNKGIRALLDRGLILYFIPNKEEMVDYIMNSFDKKELDKEVVDYISELQNFSLRDYIKALQLKKAGFKNWKELITR